MMKRTNQKGSALILAMILVLVLSVMAASMMFLSQSETWASMNYRLMTQSRYGAEAGLNAAANYLIYTYTPPSTATELSAFDMTKSPVTLAGTTTPVILSSFSDDADDAAAYPVSAVQTAYAPAATGTLQAGTTPVTYDASAQLLSMHQVKEYGTGTLKTVQTWRITGRGGIASLSNANVEVSAIMERIVSPMFAYAAFATSNQCDALQFSGNGATSNSYDSATLVANGGTATSPTFTAFGGNVGTNGNTNLVGGSTSVGGSLSTPRVGIGSQNSCQMTGGVVNYALTDNSDSTSQLAGGMIELPQNVTYPAPAAPNPMPTNTTYNPGATLVPTIGPTGTVGVAYGNISVQGNNTLTLTAGTYNVNTLSLGGSAQLIIDASLGPVILNVAGLPCDLATSTTAPTACSNTVLDLQGGGVSNASLDPTKFQIQYGGAGLVKAAGNPQAAMLIDAPYANATLNGTADFYGAIIANQVNITGGAALHYDRRLQVNYFYIGNWMLDAFTWSKY